MPGTWECRLCCGQRGFDAMLGWSWLHPVHHTVLCHNTVLYFKIKKTLNFGFKFLVLYKFGRTVVLFLKLVFLSSLFWLLEKAKKPFSAKINVLWKSSVWTQRSRRGAACRILKISKKSLLANLIIIGQVQLFSEKNIQALVYFLGKKMNCSITVLLFPIRTYKQKISYAGIQ